MLESDVQIGSSAYALSAGVTYPFISVTQRSACGLSSMKRRYSLAAFGNLLYLKTNADVKLFETVCVLTGPIGGVTFAKSGKMSGVSFLPLYHMLMPFIVMPMRPPAKALLLLTSSPAAPPSIIVS